MSTDNVYYGNSDGHWLRKNFDEIKDRFQFLITGRIPSRWLERDLFESMAKEIKNEIDDMVLESIRAIHPGKEE